VLDFNADTAWLRIGAAGNEGDLEIQDGSGRRVFHFNSDTAWLKIGDDGNEGDLEIVDGEGRRAMHFTAGTAELFIGALDNEGDIRVLDHNGREALHFDGGTAQLFIGAEDNEGDVRIRNNAGNETIHLNGETGDIILKNGDAAEDFDVADPEEAVPGTVMVLEEDGRLHPCGRAYDRRVVGVVAGAGAYRPGVILDRDPGRGTTRAPISIMGKVSVRADATVAPIGVGDLLTTSGNAGCAMPVTDPGAAFGAVLGKALTPLRDGVGMVDMLIGLQ
jgi:hypothetical protein